MFSPKGIRSQHQDTSFNHFLYFKILLLLSISDNYATQYDYIYPHLPLPCHTHLQHVPFSTSCPFFHNSLSLVNAEFFSLPQQLATDSSSVRSEVWGMLSIQILIDWVLWSYARTQMLCVHVCDGRVVYRRQNFIALFFLFIFCILYTSSSKTLSLSIGVWSECFQKVLGRLLRKRKHQ